MLKSKATCHAKGLTMVGGSTAGGSPASGLTRISAPFSLPRSRGALTVTYLGECVRPGKAESVNWTGRRRAAL